MTVATLSLFRFEGLPAKAWAFGQMQFARAPLKRLPGLTFFKLLGTGSGAGFDLMPNFGVYAVLAVWEGPEAAAAGSASPVFAAYRGHAAEWATFHLSAVQSRGHWAGVEPFEVQPGAGAGSSAPRPVAALTRASVRLRFLPAFWRRVPAISDAILAEPDLRLQLGLGEIPWLHQVTFSIWDDGEAMRAFALRSPTHGEAVRAMRRDGWFGEQLFARFALVGAEGTWKGAPAAALIRPRASAVAPGELSAASAAIAPPSPTLH